MAQTPEKKVKVKIEAILKAVGAYYFFPATHGYGRSGVPDIIACIHGNFLAIECKAGTNTPTALQERELERIRQNGGIAVVANEANSDVIRSLIIKLSSKEQSK